MWVEMLKTKDQALECFKRVKLKAELELNGKMKALRADRVGSLFSISSQFSAVKMESSTTILPHILPNRME